MRNDVHREAGFLYERATHMKTEDSYGGTCVRMLGVCHMSFFFFFVCLFVQSSVAYHL